MSEETVATVRAFLEAIWDRNDFDAALEVADPDLQLDWSESRAPYAGIVRGKKAAIQWWKDIAEAFKDYGVERRTFTDCGNGLVVVEQSIAGQGRGSGVEVRATGATLWRAHDGKVVSGKLFQSRTEALEAAGLSE